MSTRCNIIIKAENGAEILLYHHHDGYPVGVGHDLKFYLSKLRYWYADRIANALMKDKAGLNDKEYELTTGIHGDIEYAYVIDCGLQKLTCYATPFCFDCKVDRSKWQKVEIPEFNIEEHTPMYANTYTE